MRARDRRLPDGKLGPAPLRAVVELLGAAALLALLGYAAACAALWVMQDRLIFFPSPVMAPPRAPAGWRLEPVSLAMRDGVRVAGVFVRPPTSGPQPLLVYFGGNAEEVTVYAEDARSWGERAVLLVNYRGYGSSEGKPGEASLVSDALEIFDWAVAQPQVDRTRVAVHGRSLGSGVAVQLAALRPVACVVLTSPFTSAAEVGAEAYPWMPVRWLIRHPFDSARRAPAIHAPLLVLLGDEDTIVRPALSRRLAGLWGGPAAVVSVRGDHNDLRMDPRHDEAVREFLSRH